MLLALLISLALSKEIKDGETRTGLLSNIDSNRIVYSYKSLDPTSDILVLVSLFSDYSDPYLYINTVPEVSESNYLYFSTSRNEAMIRLQGSLNVTDYFILLKCREFCMYRLTVSQIEAISLQDGVPVSNSLTTGDSLLFKYEFDKVSKKTLVSLQYFGQVNMFVMVNDKPSKNNTYEVQTNWLDDFEFEWEGGKAGDVIYVRLEFEKFTDFSIVLIHSDDSPIKIQESRMIKGTIGHSKFKYYFVEVNENSDGIDISMTVYRGDADIYVSFTRQPSPDYNDFSSDSIGNDYIKLTKEDLALHQFQSGRVFISIHGAEDSSYSFVVRLHESSSVALPAGVPQESNLFPTELQNFYFPLSMISQNLSIYLTSYDGDADLYVKFCQHRCVLTASSINSAEVYRSQGSQALQTLDFSYEPESFCVFSSCNFAIAVLAKSQTYFSLVVTSGDSRIVLQQGRSFIMSFPTAGYKLYEFSVTNLTVTQVEFVLTPVFGDPDICVNFNSEEVNGCDKSSVKNGIEADIVSFYRGDERDSLAGVYLVKVLCEEGCYYSIVVRESIPMKNSTVHLIPGHPQKDVLQNVTDRDYRIYYIDVGESDHDIKIVLTGHTGKFNLFVANSEKNLDWTHEKFYYNWKGENNELLTILRSDSHFRTNSKYLILVQAIGFSGDRSATYTIQFTQGNDIFMLLSDVSISGHIRPSEYSYYSFPLHYSKLDIKISLTVSSGDPDLYLSLNYENTRPNKTNYSIRSTTFGSETLTLLWDDQISHYCPELAQEYKHGMSHGCFLYISVYSEYPSSYTLRVSPQSNLPKYLPKAGNVHGNLVKDEYEFFYTYVGTADKLIITLQNVVGDSELLVSVNDKETSSNDIQEWARPTEDKSMIKVKNLLNEEVKLNSKDLLKYCKNTCLVLISVRCMSDSCTFVIENPEEDIQKLAEGQAKYGIVGGEYQYYSYYCDQADANLVIIVTPIGQCDPSLYVSRGKDSRPSASSYEWASTSWLGDSLEINTNDEHIKGESMKGNYVIAVTSEHDECSYTLTVTNHEVPVVVLSPGLPQQGSLTAGQYMYYAFYNGNNDQVNFYLTPSLGSPYLLVSIHDEREHEFLADLPSSSLFIWNSNQGKDKYSITISSSDPHFCRHCYYLLAITSMEEAIYSVVASSEDHIKVLLSGVPFKKETHSSEVNIYSFTTNGNDAVHISVAEYSGQVDFGVSLEKDSTDFDWKSEKGHKTKSLVIDSKDPKLSAGTYYISVSTSDSSALYSIVFYQEGSYISLIDGWPLMYAMRAEAKSPVKFKFDQSGSVFCMLESASPTFLPSVSAYKKSKSTNVEKLLIHYHAGNYTDRHILMDFVLQANESILLHLTSPGNFSSSYAEISLYCTKSFHPGMLALGIQSIGHLTLTRPALRYEVSSTYKQTFSIYVTPCVGSVYLQASTNWTVIKGEPTLLTSFKMTDGVIFGKVKDFEGKLYLTVNNKDETQPANFKILVDSQQLPRVYPGNEGFISWDFEKEKIILQWAGLTYADGTLFEGKLTYHVFYTKHGWVDMQTTCQVQYAVASKYGEWVGSSKTTQAEIEIKKDGYLTVVALVEEYGFVALNEIIYDKVQIEGIGSRTSSLKLIFILSLTVLVLAGIAGFVFFKYRKVKIESKVFKDYGKQIGVADDTIVHDGK